MAIINLEHRCPVCNALFCVSYDKSKLEKGLDTAIEYLGMLCDVEYGGIGRVLAKTVIKGKDYAIRELTGKAQYSFKCPKCGYESQLIIL
jgi:transcription elongation factor Elf1